MMHQRISKKIIIYLFIFFTLVTINNKKLSNDFYIIKKFNINGLSNLETRKILDLGCGTGKHDAKPYICRDRAQAFDHTKSR